MPRTELLLQSVVESPARRVEQSDVGHDDRFLDEHREYSNDSYTNYATSVAEIERLTGFDFFANLPADIQAAAEQNSNWNTFASF